MSDQPQAEDLLKPMGVRQLLRLRARTLIDLTHVIEVDCVGNHVALTQLASPEQGKLRGGRAIQRYIHSLAQDMQTHAALPRGAEVDWSFLANVFVHSICTWQQSERLIRNVIDEELIAFSDAVIETILKSVPKASEEGA